MVKTDLGFGAFQVPPRTKGLLTPAKLLAERLAVLIGEPFRLTGKTRTDGSTLRKLVAETLGRYGLPLPAASSGFQIVPPKEKGVPRILLEYVDTYIVTTGNSYNLQVWNRNPASDSVQVQYGDGTTLLASEVRFVFLRIDTKKHRVRSVAVLSPAYIEQHFGRFGKPTIKQQLIITAPARAAVLARTPPILFYPDDSSVSRIVSPNPTINPSGIHEEPAAGRVASLDRIRDIVERSLLRRQILAAATKNRGQALEILVAEFLGYRITTADLLAGGHPDLRAQALEVKLQDSPTVDLGRFSPEFEEPIPGCPGFTTKTVRYLIALTDASSGKVEGAIVCPGGLLGKHFTYVADESFKCQRSIPMSFFDSFDGKAVHNP